MNAEDERDIIYSEITSFLEEKYPEIGYLFRKKVSAMWPGFYDKKIKKISRNDLLLLLVKSSMRDPNSRPPRPFEIRNLQEVEICHGEIINFNCNRQFNYIAIFTNETSFLLCDSTLNSFIRLFFKEFRTDSSAKLLYEKDFFIIQASIRLVISLSIEKVYIFSHFDFEKDIIFSASSLNGKYITVILDDSSIMLFCVVDKIIKLHKTISDCVGTKSISFSNDGNFIIYIKNYTEVIIYCISIDIMTTIKLQNEALRA